MAVPAIQTSFNAGALTPSVWGHVDFAKFAVGASTMRNAWVDYRGGARSRAGTAFVGYSKQTVLNTASGLIHFAGNPSDGDTITLNGAVFTFTNVPAGAYQLAIGVNAGGTVALAIIQLTTNGTLLADTRLNVATYSDTGGSTTDDLVITYKTQSSAGNGYTLAASVATPSGAHLTGGGNNAPRLITFQFNLNQGLALEFGQEYMRVISDGAYVTEAATAITGATQGDPCIIHDVAHGYVTGDWIYISNVGGMTQLNGHTYVITRIDADHFSLADVFGVAIDSSAFGAYTSGGTAARIYTLVTPYQAIDLLFLKFTQSADVMSLTLRNQISGAEYRAYDLARFADDNWTLTALNTGSSIAAPTGVALSSDTTGVGTIVDYSYCVTAIDGATFEESVASDAPHIQYVDISATAGSIAITWDPVASASYYNVYKAPPAYNQTVPDGSLYGLCGTTYGNRLVDSNIIADMSIVPPLHENPFAANGAISVTITDGGSSLIGPITFVIHTSTGSGATGFGVLVGGVMTDFVFTASGEGYLVPPDTITFGDGGGVAASGDISFTSSGNPSNGDTITLNGAVFTFVNDGSGWPSYPSNYKINIGNSLGGTLAFLADPLAGALTTGTTYLADPLLNVADYALNDPTDDTLDITYKTGGTAGNAYTLAASAAAPSAGTLTGGTGGTVPTGTLVLGPSSGTYPSAVAYFQQRRAYANTANQPDTYWMSQPGAFTNFDARVPSIDSDAITGTPWSVQVDGIQFMLPLIGSLIVLTGQAAYVVGGAGTSPTSPQPITPTSQQALPQAYNGCHFHVAPVVIDFDIYYVQAKGSIIRSLSYNFWVNVFTGIDVTYLSSHMFLGYQINAMAWCQEPWKILWAVRDDGVLLSLTSVKTQDVMGWARHDTQGLFVGATAVTESAAGETPIDALYVVTQRFAPNGRSPFMIERMDSRLWSSVESAWCVDCALSLPQPTPDAVLTIGSGGATGAGIPLVVIDAGGANYSADTVIGIKDPTGTGWTFSSVVLDANGAIIAINSAGGLLYTNPIVTINDPNNLGSGFAAHAELVNSVALTTDAPVFSVGDASGGIVRCGGGVIEIFQYNSATSVNGAVISPILAFIPNDPNDTVLPFQPGEWSKTAAITTVTGLNHLAGFQVTGLADGNVIPPQTVAANGTITLANPASSIVVGLAFTAQLQSLYAEGGNPTEQGRRKQIAAVTVRLEESGASATGTNQPDGSALSPRRVQVAWSSLTEQNLTTIAPLPFGNATTIQNNINYTRPRPLYTGDVRVYPTAGYEKMGQVAVQQSQPLPCSVLAFIREVDVGDTPDVKQPAQPRQGRGR